MTARRCSSEVVTSREDVHPHIYRYICVFVCMCMCMHIYMDIYLCVYSILCILYISMYIIYIYIYIYIHIYITTRSHLLWPRHGDTRWHATCQTGPDDETGTGQSVEWQELRHSPVHPHMAHGPHARGLIEAPWVGSWALGLLGSWAFGLGLSRDGVVVC